MTAALAPLDATPGRAGGPRAAPRITSRRLVLREMRLEDWPGYRDMMTSMRAVHMGGPFGLNVAWCAFCADLAGWGITGAGALTVEREGVVVGQVVLNDIPAVQGLNPSEFTSAKQEEIWNTFVEDWLPQVEYSRYFDDPRIDQAVADALAAVATGQQTPDEAAAAVQSVQDEVLAD